MLLPSDSGQSSPIRAEKREGRLAKKSFVLSRNWKKNLLNCRDVRMARTPGDSLKARTNKEDSARKNKGQNSLRRVLRLRKIFRKMKNV